MMAHVSGNIFFTQSIPSYKYTICYILNASVLSYISIRKANSKVVEYLTQTVHSSFINIYVYKGTITFSFVASWINQPLEMNPKEKTKKTKQNNPHRPPPPATQTTRSELKSCLTEYIGITPINFKEEVLCLCLLRCRSVKLTWGLGWIQTTGIIAGQIQPEVMRDLAATVMVRGLAAVISYPLTWGWCSQWSRWEGVITGES